MYLKDLSISGFKSFARKSELEFSTPITAIVGPNGSGKSNVAEAFRFVLGEQSVKSLRGKRGEDLIWGGSDAVTRGNRAGVTVTFDNTKRNIDLDFDEVVIERVVHRDGQNEYKINGSAVRLKDVHELLASAHIGATGHHIISQGEADRVISAGARERREMIEDALGLKVYQLKKQDATRKLEKTQTNIAQTESLRREAAPHLKYLQKQVERAERSLQVQAELRQSYAAYLKREDVYLAVRTDQLTAARRAPVAQLEQLTQDIAALKSQLADTAIEPDTSALDQAVTAERAAQQSVAQATRALSTLEGQITLLQRRISAARARTEPVDELIPRSRLQELVTSLTTSVQQAITKRDLDQLVTTIERALRELGAFVAEAPVVTTDQTEADTAELETVQANVPEATATVAAAKETEARATADVAAARAVLTQQSTQAHAAERSLFEKMNTDRELRQQIQLIDTELSVLDRDRQEFKRELQEAVSLIGRGAMDYTAHQISDDTGVIVSEQALLDEGRDVQRERRRQLEKLKIRLEELGIGATDELLKEYNDAKERDAFLAEELSDLVSSVANLQTLITEMDAQLHEQFVAGIDKISVEFNRFFTLMFGGGSATLERVQIKTRGDDQEEEVSVVNEGVELQVSLPNKRVKGLEMLSGGERALTSIALIFAMSQVNPPPFIILDETDAALDEANSRRYGDMIQALAQRSQLVLITHNRETMSRAGILYGITMGVEGVSKVLSVKFDEAAANAK